MIKAIYFIKRKPGMALEDFRKYWLEGSRRVGAQSSGPREICAIAHDGFRISQARADLRWHRGVVVREPRRYAQDREYADQRATLADDEKFLDMSKFAFILTKERVQKENPIEAGMPKMVAFLKKRPELSVEQFQAHWNSPHGKLGSAVPGARRYVQSHPLMSSYQKGRTPLWDGVAEVWFENEDAMRSNANTPEYKAVLADEPNFLAENAKFIITTERVIL